MRISIITGVIGVFVVLSALPASAEKLTLACTFESGSFGRERDVNQVVFDTDRPRVDLRVAQTMDRDCARARSKILGAACSEQSSAPLERSRRLQQSPRTSRADLRLVHRGISYARFARGKKFN